VEVSLLNIKPRKSTCSNTRGSQKLAKNLQTRARLVNISTCIDDRRSVDGAMCSNMQKYISFGMIGKIRFAVCRAGAGENSEIELMGEVGCMSTANQARRSLLQPQ
jgi:hypothetical protein